MTDRTTTGHTSQGDGGPGRTSRRAVLGAAAAVPLAGAVAGCQMRAGVAGSNGDRSPFTGEQGRGGKVLAVKIDNIRSARPSVGLERADIVYAEQVEAGLSRLMAVFSSRFPRRVGPVRSARESDLELLRQFGRPILAYSGVQSKLQPALDAAPLTPLIPEKTKGVYERSAERSSPHNLFLKPDQALRAAPKAGDAADIGFRFGPAPSGGRAASHRSVRFPDARFDFDWSARSGRWLVSMDGSPAKSENGPRLGAATVVLQHVKIRSSSLRDVNDEVSPYSETVGSGRAVVLRDGKAYEGRWSRPSPADGTRFTGQDGRSLPFARGPVWVVLAPAE
ncbi:DUF3048 domain-containing protein [Streptomyces sp. ODS28]|uniref:DUF3048 domain-containing protein n=1 Tax=Streptomyces sp. ODS28 TaxID=3136688 RepID=UPI0031EC199F